MQCVRCGVDEFVIVARTRRVFSALGIVWARRRGMLLVCANCGCEQRAFPGGVRQTLKGTVPPAPPAQDGAQPPKRDTPVMLRDSDQRWSRR